MNNSKIASKLINYYINDQQFFDLCNLIIKESVESEFSNKRLCYCETFFFKRIIKIYSDLLIDYLPLDYFLEGIRIESIVPSKTNRIFYHAGAQAKKLSKLKKFIL